MSILKGTIVVLCTGYTTRLLPRIECLAEVLKSEYDIILLGLFDFDIPTYWDSFEHNDGIYETIFHDVKDGILVLSLPLNYEDTPLVAIAHAIEVLGTDGEFGYCGNLSMNSLYSIQTTDNGNGKTVLIVTFDTESG